MSTDRGYRSYPKIPQPDELRSSLTSNKRLSQSMLSNADFGDLLRHPPSSTAKEGSSQSAKLSNADVSGLPMRSSRGPRRSYTVGDLARSNSTIPHLDELKSSLTSKQRLSLSQSIKLSNADVKETLELEELLNHRLEGMPKDPLPKCDVDENREMLKIFPNHADALRSSLISRNWTPKTNPRQSFKMPSADHPDDGVDDSFAPQARRYSKEENGNSVRMPRRKSGVVASHRNSRNGIEVSNTHEVRGYSTEENGEARRKSRKSGETASRRNSGNNDISNAHQVRRYSEEENGERGIRSSWKSEAEGIV